jgi:ring-1,2-phenylacetyl-CoA epoxidase subunit PaaD
VTTMTHPETDTDRARRVVEGVPDPELPFVTLGDLGIVGEVTLDGSAADDGRSVRVRLTPTYLGCPALEVIERDVVAALRADRWPAVSVEWSLTPPWTTDLITGAGREKLAAAGIAPPTGHAPAGGPSGPIPVALGVRCPQCGSPETAVLSRFGASPCQELRRCARCAEPFPAIRVGIGGAR